MVTLRVTDKALGKKTITTLSCGLLLMIRTSCLALLSKFKLSFLNNNERILVTGWWVVSWFVYPFCVVPHMKLGLNDNACQRWVMMNEAGWPLTV